jgi:predicted dinucleotide-binding enzyme
MKIAVLGTGMVGNAIATKLVALGHEVMMGSRTRDNEKALAWVKDTGQGASAGTFAEAAAFGELAFNCTLGAGALDALRSTGTALDGKIVIDTSNPLDFSKGMPPTLFSGNTDSLGEQIQRELPKLKVVKSLNTMSCNIMVDAGRVKGDHDVFMSGNDKEAKGRVREILQGWFGWKNVIDLGDISTARGTESYLPLWIRLWGVLGTADFNIKIVR